MMERIVERMSGNYSAALERERQALRALGQIAIAVGLTPEYCTADDVVRAVCDLTIRRRPERAD